MQQSVSTKQALAYQERMAEMSGLKSGAIFRFLRPENTPVGQAEKQLALIQKFQHENFLARWLEMYWRQYNAAFQRMLILQKRINELSEKTSALIETLENAQMQGGLSCTKTRNTERSQSICHTLCIRSVMMSFGAGLQNISDGVQNISELLEKMRRVKKNLDNVDQNFIQPALRTFEDKDMIPQKELDDLEKKMDAIEDDIPSYDLSYEDEEVEIEKTSEEHDFNL